MQRAVWNTDRSLTIRLSERTCMEWQYWRYAEMPWALRHHERIPESSHRTGLLGSLFDAEELPSWNDNCQFLHGFHAFAGTIPTGKRELNLKCV